MLTYGLLITRDIGTNLKLVNMRLFRRKKKVEVTLSDLYAIQYAIKRLHYTYGERESQAFMIDMKNLEGKMQRVLLPNL